ncbi:class I SAM-dependent methyltransferase [Staphylothermus hellenicus]|uniref:Methyltransferase type 11 n=1 Tax=Staphylothermus hellenicus (strain DSM 12710 / JCM 10830 / BK20S6-10-b1 / P8) TaxID=591019 RepID=D7D901_STAHD|nr:class I SAM-dependent methyltransferase [Staphylothermus hellenicus]ADI32247.1 Methyltransferase type 11 [Staphylothermus hellenicus DSM 12710]
MTSSKTRNKHVDPVKLYNITARTYDSLYKKEQYIKYNYVFEELRLIPGKNVLDIGCGTGLLIEYLLSKKLDLFHRYLCVDPSIEMLKNAIDKHSDPRIIYVLSYAEDLALTNQSINSIFMFTVWNNIPETNKESILDKIKNLLTKNGYAIITTIPRNKTYNRQSSPPDLNNEFKYVGSKIDDFYIYKKRS